MFIAHIFRMLNTIMLLLKIWLLGAQLSIANFNHPTELFDAHLQENPANICISLTLLETRAWSSICS